MSISNWILVINPGSTSTKVAIFKDEKEFVSASIPHSKDDLESFTRIFDQYLMRVGMIEQILKENHVNLKKITAVVGRGGLLRPIVGGTYVVNKRMIDDLKKASRGEHASNLGGIIAYEFAQKIGVKAYIVDPVVVDEMEATAKITGIPEIERRSIFHALNQRAVAKRASVELGQSYQEVNLIVAHLGGGISIGCHKHGRVIDVNNALDGDGPFSPERAGSLPTGQLVDFCFSGKYTITEIKRKLVGHGGMVAHLGTNDLREVKKKIEQGDEQAKLIFNSMIHQIAKEIGAAAAVLDGRVDAIILSGGLAYEKELIRKIKGKIGWIARILVYPGEKEMHALAQGVLGVLNKKEKAKEY